jgi:cytochrome b6-f complex iron-sulfur subunit
MRNLSLWPIVLGIAAAMIVVVIIEPTRHSLSYAGAVLTLIGLIGWVIEARQVAGPPPAVEPEHEEEEEAPGPSYWPIVLALGVVSIAGGLVYTWDYGALIVAVPLAGAAAAAWGQAVSREQMELERAPAVVLAPGGLAPVPQSVLAAQAAQGAAIAIERYPTRQVSRRNLLRVTFWAGMGAGLAGSVGVLFDMLWPRGITGFGGIVSAGNVADYPPGSKTEVSAGKFWLVNLTAEQGGPGFLALWWKCPHLGCTVPWRENFSFVDPNTAQETRGWFRCPCHGSTYTHAGVRVFGPAPRSMDRMEVTIDPSSGAITVNTGKISKGTPDNAKFAVKAP